MNRNELPQRTMHSLRRYADQRIPTGDFLYAVLTNNLMEAIGRADDENLEAIYGICMYVYNDIPATCHGSKEIVDEWLRGK